MRRIIIPGFKGGKSNSLFDPLEKQTFQTAKDLNIYSNQNILSPHTLKLTNITAPTITGGSDYKFFNSFTASNGKLYVIGQATISATNNFVLWSTSTLEASPTWAADYNVAVGFVGTSCDEFKDGLYFGQGTNFDRWGDLSGTPSRTNIGTVTTGATVIRTHRGLGKIFFVHNSGHTVGSYDGTTFTATALTVEKSQTIISMKPYGRFMILGVQGIGSVPSRFIIWDGSATTIEDQWEVGVGHLQGFELVNGTVRYITSIQDSSGYLTNRLYELVPGGNPQLINEQRTTLTIGTLGIHLQATSTLGDLFLWGYKGSTHGIDLGIFSYGSGLSSETKAYSAPTHLVNSGVTTGVSVASIDTGGGRFVVIWSTLNGSGTYYIDAYGNNITAATTANGVYQSNAFLLNKGDPGKIQRIIIPHKPIPTSTGFTVAVKHFGHYPWASSTPSEDSFTNLATPNGSGSSTGVTQSTDNATYTIIEDPNIFNEARHAQLQISFDEVSGVNAASIIFPIFIDVD